MTGFVKMLLIAFFVFAIISCEKEISPKDLQVYYEADFPLKDIVFDGEEWFAVGGEVFESGNIVSGILDSITNFQSISSTCINSIKKNENSNLEEKWNITGVYSLGRRLLDSWQLIQLSDPFIMRELILKDDLYYAIGGAGLSAGVLYTLDLNMNIVEQKTFGNDLYFIRQIKDKIYVGGFGLLMQTDKLNEVESDWTLLDEYEDHWLDIDYDETLGIVVLGASGRIIRSKDDGRTWSELLNPVLSGVSDLNDMLVYDGRIYLAGDVNICASDIEIIEWETIQLENVGEINKMIGNNGRIFFVTNTGKMASIAR